MSLDESPYQLLSDWPRPPGHRAPCALLLLTADGLVHSANATAQRWFGPVPPQMTGLARYLGESDPQPGWVKIQDFARKLSREHRADPIEVHLIRRDGSTIEAELSAFPLMEPEGVYLGCDLAVFDLGERRQRERLVAASEHERLLERVDERTRSLKWANSDLDAFSQLVSHDLRGPLRHIQGYLSLARERVEAARDDALLEYHRASSQAAQRMGEMIDGLIEYSRLARVPVNRQRVALGSLVQGLIARQRLTPERAPIEWRISPDLPVVRGDPMLLAQALDHLLDNAVKFTRDAPQPVIEVSAETGDGDLSTVTVRDNGSGFDRNNASNLFVLFQRQHHSMDYPGMGTGLAIAQRIVQRHGGRMSCDSAPGAGCTVTFTLPMDLALDADAP